MKNKNASALSSNVQEITPAELPQLLAAISTANRGLPANEQLVLYVASAPGIGKSSIIGSFARKHERQFVDTRLAYSAPTDVQGFPMLTPEGRMAFAPSAEYPTEPGGVWLLDEFSVAPRATQLAALQLLLDKKIGQYEVPKDTLLVLAGNRAIDRAHVERMSSAVINRIVQVTLRVDYDSWVHWAIDSGINPNVVAFVAFRPDLLSSFDAATWDGDSGFASPRSWTTASNILKGVTGLPKHLRLSLLQGCLGPAVGIEFSAFLDIADALPDVDKMLKNPEKAEVPDKPDVLLALLAALVTRAKKENFPAILTLISSFPKEFEVLTIRMIARREPAMLNCKEAVSWITDNGDALR